MSLTEKQEKQLKNMPAISNKILKSKDGQFIIHKTEIVSIKPIAYYEAVLASEEEAS